MKKSICLALFVALVVASPRAQGTSISGNIIPALTISAGALPGLIALNTQLDVYLITVNSDTAADVTAFDLVFTGSFAQVQLGDGFGATVPSPFHATVPGGAAGHDQDTHLDPTLTIPGGSVPTEGLNGFTSTGTGFGAGLSSDPVGILGAEQAPSVIVAQIVMLKGGIGSFSGTVAIAGNPNPVAVSGPIGIPEPATFWLACISLIGMVTSRGRLMV